MLEELVELICCWISAELPRLTAEFAVSGREVEKMFMTDIP
jgi:hypothetical protein